MFGIKKDKKVYLVNGLLESGKTEFIKYTLDQPYFKAKGTTLMILCEEGENSYERAFLRRNKVELVKVEEEEDFTLELLNKLEEEHKPVRVLIEYNGMWSHKPFEMPSRWKIEQQITTIDTTTFAMFYANMKSVIGEMVRNSDLILFNRADNVPELATFKRNVKMVNQSADIVFEGAEAEISAVLDEELPYDVNADVIEITDETYGTWFLDSLDHVERYVGKKVSFVGKVLRRDNFPEDRFVPMRVVMTCCEDDLATLGFICKFDGAKEFATDSWVKVEAVVQNEYWEDYDGDGPVLHATSVESCDTPKNEILGV